MDKAQARAEVERRLAELGPDARREASARIRQRLLELPEFARAGTVMLYVSLPDEVNTIPILVDAMAAGKRVAVPKVDKRRKVMNARVVNDVEEDLVPGVFDIPEPRDTEIVAPSQIGFIVVPGRAFDRQGNRVGRGGGYYDRFLSSPGFHAARCGIAFAAQVLDEVPHDEHDRPLHILVTEEGVLRFGA